MGKRQIVTDASLRSLRGLNALNFCIAFMQTGFGPLFAVRLAAAGWNDQAIGTVLAAGVFVPMLAQVPTGIIIDRVHAKRAMAALAIVVTIGALATMALTDAFLPALLAQGAHGAAGVGLSVSIAAITLSLSQQSALGERLGTNVRYAAVGAALGSGLLGLAGSHLTLPLTFLLAAAAGVAALAALWAIHPVDIATGHLRSTHRTVHRYHTRAEKLAPLRRMLRRPALLPLLAVAVLFQLGNAMLLPLAATKITRMAGMDASEVVGALGIGAQLVNAGFSPWMGRWAQHYGRRPVLVLGLLAVPVRALLFAVGTPLWLMLTAELLDGISAAAIGVLLPLIVADITHRGGWFNLLLGIVGLASSVGALVSTSTAGTIADAFGLRAAFLALGAAAAAAVFAAAFLLPETASLCAAAPAQQPAI